MKTIGASKFKEQCLALLDHFEGHGPVITKHGKPVARVVPYAQNFAELIGSLRDQIDIKGDIVSTGAVWRTDAES